MDPNGNGDPKDDTSPTFVTIPVDATVGIAKSASVYRLEGHLRPGPGEHRKRRGSQITVKDDLDAVFGAGNYAVATAPFFMEDPGTLLLNPGFTGSGGDGVLAPAQAGTNTLAPVTRP